MTAPAADEWLRFTHGVSDLLEQATGSPGDLLDRVVRTAVATIPGVEDASVSLLHEEQHRSVTASGDLPREFDSAQEDAGQGPCVSSIREHTTVVVDDLLRDGRWPLLREESGAQGPRSTLSVPLEIARQTGGGTVPVGLNLLSSRAGSFDGAAVTMGGTLAWCASSVITEGDVRDAVVGLPRRRGRRTPSPHVEWHPADRALLRDLAQGLSASAAAGRAGIRLTTLAARLARMRRQRGLMSTNELIARFTQEELDRPEP